MKGRVFLIVILALFLMPVVNPSLSSMPPAIVHESQFTMSADGDESSESITSFSETLPDDVLFYPDGSFFNSTILYSDAGDSDAGDSNPDIQTGSYTDTAAVDATNYVIGDNDGVTIWILLNFTVPTWATIEGFNYSSYALGECVDTPTTEDVFQVWNYDTTAWVELGELSDGSLGWINGTTYVSDYWTTVIKFRYFANGVAAADAGLEVDYLGLEFYYMTLADSGHFAESFVDVSDWNSPSTDGDIGTIEGDAWIHHWTDSPSFVATDALYLEYKVKANKSVAGRLFGYQADAKAGGYSFYTPFDSLTTTWQTIKHYIPSLIVYGDHALESLSYSCDTDDFSIYFDYLRIGPADEMGWQHDGSTTAGVTNDGDGDKTYSASSDGDILTLNITTDVGSTGSGYYNIYFDTTTTLIDLDRDYYPFVEVKMRLIGNTGGILAPFFTADGYRTTIVSSLVETDWTTYRVNHKAATTTEGGTRVYFYWGAGDAKTVEIELDFIKLASIANFTHTQGASITTNDFWYTSGGVLYGEADSGDYMQLNHDPALSVAQATYPVWNISSTLSNLGGSFNFKLAMPAWNTFSDEETRGAVPTGTITDIAFNTYLDTNIIAIKFIEDGTNPTVIRSNVNPPEPDDDETVTLSSVITDGVEVYSVKYNALVYPAGFSDVDYSATETATNFWTYSFSSGVLPTGYYSFAVIANDGANENGLLTEPEYIDFTVRISEITITPITFFGVGDDFSQMQISFEINKDCTFTIYEASDSVAETDTHTGSVSEGWDNIAWDKLTTTDTAVNFSISFVSGSLSTWINGSYAVAQVVFDVVLSDKTTTFDYVYLEGESTKAAAYAVYDINNVLRSSGTIPEGSFALSFEIWNKKSLTETFYGVKFTNGSSTDWINGTYYADDPEEYKGGGVVTVPPWWQDPMTWVIIGGFAALMFIATSGQKVGSLPNAPKDLK